MKNHNFYNEKLDQLKNDYNFRSLENLQIFDKYIIKNGKKMLNLSSNDYLGISCDENLRTEFLKNYTKQIAIPSARLLCANSNSYYELEEYLAQKFNKEKALLLNSGYHANLAIYSTLAKSGDVIFCDKLNHASIIDGIKLGGAKLIPYNHLDYEDLENKLKKYRKNFKNALIATEALFSMDGDFCELKPLVKLKNKYDCLLIVDEAHSFGVYGKGLGHCAEQNQLQNVDLIMATFGKAIGSYGAFCVGNKVLINYLINFARPFIFSTVFPQICAEFAKFVLENKIFTKDNHLQNKLLDLQNLTHNLLKDFQILGSSYIIPIIFGENKKAIEASQKMQNNGFYCLPIRYPTVKKNTARLRLSLNSAIEKWEIEKLADYIKKL